VTRAAVVLAAPAAPSTLAIDDVDKKLVSPLLTSTSALDREEEVWKNAQRTTFSILNFLFLPP
jgi:hypothetical protein